MDHAVALDVTPLRDRAHRIERLPEEKCPADYIVDIFGLHKKSAGSTHTFFELSESEHRLEGIFPVDVMREHQDRSLSLRNRAQTNPRVRVGLVPCTQYQKPYVCSRFESVCIDALRFIVTVLLVPPHNVVQCNSYQICMPPPQIVPENCGRPILESSQDLCPRRWLVSICPDDLLDRRRTKRNLPFLRAIQIAKDGVC